MKKNIKKETKKNQEKRTAALLSALGQRDANSLVIGIDLGDRTSSYCVRTREQEMVVEAIVATTAQAMLEMFQPLQRQRVVMETGTHSRWVAELLGMLGHEVIVGNARKLKLITENEQKSDRVDARLLSKLGCLSVDWLHPVYQRSGEAHRDLLVVRAREALVETRTALINHVRGIVKSFGSRLRSCGSDQFVEVAKAELPVVLQGVLSGVLATLAEIQEQIYSYECRIKHLCQSKYEQTSWLLQVKGVGPVTALTYVLTIEDAQRFERSRDVGAYLGLVPKKRQSGKRDPQLGISKTGDEMLRKLLVNCAHHILGPVGAESDLRRWGLGLVEAGQRAGQKGARKRAAAAVARKLAVLLHRLWVEKQKYEPLRNVATPKAA
jgi:transposase